MSVDQSDAGMLPRDRLPPSSEVYLMLNGQSDIYIHGMKHRNRALNGDVVVVLPSPKDQWKSVESICVGDGGLEQLCIASKAGADILNLSEAGQKTENEASQVPGSDSHPEQNLSGLEQPQHPTTSGSNKATTKHHQFNKYTSVGDLKADWSAASPTAQKLFQTKTDPSNRALHSINQLPDSVLQITAKVIYIIERKHSRACTGQIHILQDKNTDLALFSPKDSRVPRILVPMADCPKDFMQRPQDYKNTLFIARITDWAETSKFPRGQLLRSLGEAGQIEPETEGLLMEYDVDYSDFSEQVLACLPQTFPWSIPEKELSSRRDLRNLCIFTIDPATARDLDDALSCVPLDNGRFEIGVHIADVSYFVELDSDLDLEAASRATSVYLVQKVIPMLPGLLCEQLCSLNPGEDRLSFSVIWTITEDGLIESEWFGRTIIRPSVKLSYDHAQGFIDEPDKQWTANELPHIDGGYSVEHIKNIVLQLDKIAKKLRRKRTDNGALRLDQIKLQYSLDKETGLPNGYSVYQQKDSNRLVEEFMLLANMAVARKIYQHFPDIAVLRRHPKPQERMLNDLQSLEVYSREGEENRSKFLILTSLCSKPMQNARYFCTGVIDDESLYRHYALSVPFYTHFTSPIRRYDPPPQMSKGEVQQEAEHCNDKKLSAKRVSELSSELYFAIFIKECGPIEEQAMVMAVLDKAFDVLILKLGVIKRVYLEAVVLHPDDVLSL
ncbi:hypothetical protein LSH36_683g03080 [Paralvinella palmiformis]|uniref:RNB domain-containing protein n=1 Tax=Paralvinella palmiformis TaxID=53620 RepID=A0AAD9J300_9ANNE|nr:hypothetical protein LSH36_683g03080 [Paralvinella palmiformis]